MAPERSYLQKEGGATYGVHMGIKWVHTWGLHSGKVEPPFPLPHLPPHISLPSPLPLLPHLAGPRKRSPSLKRITSPRKPPAPNTCPLPLTWQAPGSAAPH